MGVELYPTSEPRFVGPAEDVEAIRRAHRDWWAGNHTQEIPRCERNFAPQTLMFNLNGHTYYGLDEMVRVWTLLCEIRDIETCVIWDYRIFVDGNMAYVTSEGTFPVAAAGDGVSGGSVTKVGEHGAPNPLHFRETSVFRRDDGAGNPEWRMWHFHCSSAAPDDEPRPGFDDTWISRGGDRGGSIVQTVELPAP